VPLDSDYKAYYISNISKKEKKPGRHFATAPIPSSPDLPIYIIILCQIEVIV
jgi:hypothetical protein